MATTNAKVFVGTNILLRATISRFPQHEQARLLVAQQIESDAELWVSRQVIREYIAQATRPQMFINPMSMVQVEAQIKSIRALFQIADDTEQVTTELLRLLATYPTGGKKVHDANVVATMLVNNIETLLTTNLKDLRRFSNEITLISFTEQ